MQFVIQPHTLSQNCQELNIRVLDKNVYLHLRRGGADLIKLYFFANEDFFPFFAGKLARLLLKEKIIIDYKMT